MEPWPLPNGWRWRPLNALVKYESGEWGAEPASSDIDVPVVRSTETRGLVVDLNAAAVRSLSTRSLAKTQLAEGDILVVKSSGSAHLVGRPSMVRALEGRAAGFSNFMLRLRPRDGVPSEYVFAFLASEMGRQLFETFNNTTSGLRNLQLGRYLELPVPVPPDDELKACVARLEEIVAVEDALTVATRQVEQLRRSLNWSVFSGSVQK